MDYKELEQIFIGQWDEVLKSFGVVVPQMKGKNSINHPCPLCGGDDRAHWRLTEGRLSLYCRNCTGDTMKSVENVIMEYNNLTFAELCKELSALAGLTDDEFIAKGQQRAQAAPKRNMPQGHKQDHDKATEFLAKQKLVSRHLIFDRFSVQHPEHVAAKDNAIFLPVKNESDALVNVFAVFYDKQSDKVKTQHLAGGVSYGAWHKIEKCDVRQTNGIAWCTSAIKGLHHYWTTGKEVRIVFDINNLIWCLNVGIISKEDELVLTEKEKELLPE